MKLSQLYKQHKQIQKSIISKPSSKVVSKQTKIPTVKTGLWNKKLNTVIIPSNKITMKGPNGENDFFKKPVLGKGLQSGRTILMEPGKEYLFPDDKQVIEKRLQKGGYTRNEIYKDAERLVDKELEYLKSPEYKTLLQKEFYGDGDPTSSLDDMISTKESNLQSLRVDVPYFPNIEMNKNYAGGYDPVYHKIKIKKETYDPSVFRHEMSHSLDSSYTPGADKVGENFQKVLKEDLSKKKKEDIKETLDDPSEVKARLKALRDKSIEQGYKLLEPGYDINNYKDSFTPMENMQYKQLKDAGITDEEINKYMYLFAKQDSQSQKVTAQNGADIPVEIDALYSRYNKDTRQYMQDGAELPKLVSKMDIANFYKNPLSNKYSIIQNPDTGAYEYYLKDSKPTSDVVQPLREENIKKSYSPIDTSKKSPVILPDVISDQEANRRIIDSQIYDKNIGPVLDPTSLPVPEPPKPLPLKKSKPKVTPAPKPVYANRFKDDRRQLPHTGVIIDRGTNIGYLATEDGIYEFPVLTGRSTDPNAMKHVNASIQTKEIDPSTAVTPLGYFRMDNGVSDGSKYDNNIRGLRGFSAFGEPMRRAGGGGTRTAIHQTYNPTVREPLYKKGSEERRASAGCVNCRRPDYERIERSIPANDTMFIFDSRLPRDQHFIQNVNSRKKVFQEGGETSTEENPSRIASVNVKAEDNIFKKARRGYNKLKASLFKTMSKNPALLSSYLNTAEVLDKTGDIVTKSIGTVLPKNLIFEKVRPVDYPESNPLLFTVDAALRYAGKDAEPLKDAFGNYVPGEEIYRKILGFNDSFNYIENSPYKPSKVKDGEESKYIKFRNLYDPQKLINAYVKAQKTLPEGKTNTVIPSLDPYIVNRESLESSGLPFNQQDPLQNFTLDKGEDEKGKYISLYDIYDFSGPANNLLYGFRKPVEVYDRFYYEKDQRGFPVYRKDKMQMGGMSIPEVNGTVVAPSLYDKKKQYKSGGQHGGLDRWFAEKWVDVKSGKQCGRQEGENRAYPACRPSKRISSKTPKTSSEMSSSEKAKFKSTKTSSQRIPYNHKRK